MLEALSQVQATPGEIEKLTSITTIQTKGLKKYFQEQKSDSKPKSKRDNAVSNGTIKINSLKGAKRKQIVPNKPFKSNDPNVVGFDSSGSSESEDSSEDELPNKKPKLDEGVSKTIENIKKKEVTEKSEEKLIETKEQHESSKSKEVSKETSVRKTKETQDKTKEKCVTAKQNNLQSITNDKTKHTEVPKATNSVERKPAVFVEVCRTKEIQAARLKLPILAEEQVIMEAINENPILILAGETGSGKTTQVPQFLYEAGYAIDKQIAVTEPRRVAAIAMSQRVAEEMNLSSDEVSYLIRFGGNVTEKTKIKFMTDGVLLKEFKKDYLLSKYSVVILDEAHERSVHTDILIGLLSRIVPLRHKKNNPLKLIIMSATLRLEDFTENKRLFKVTPPVIEVKTRQFPVVVHFNKRTNDNYLKDAFKKACKIHTTLPEGGILIFVTGQQEVNTLVRKLRKAFPVRRKNTPTNKNSNCERSGSGSDDDEIEQGLKRALKNKRKQKRVPDINLDDYSIPGDNENDSDEDLSNVESDDEEIIVNNSQPMWVLPLYSLLPSHKQAEVFKDPPDGCRVCIVSTNVAETSLTIPNIKYVVDTGKTKVKLYDKVTGVSSYVVTWTSKASAKQRAGRAGRLGPGHCYGLYSSAVFNDTFQEFNVPDIRQKPVDDLFLLLKSMHINDVVNFPFPTAPDMLQLKSAENRLTILGALKAGKLTELGRVISRFPVLPRFGKMLALSNQYNLLPYSILLVAALSVQEVLLENPILPSSAEEVKNVRQKWAALRRHWAGTGNFFLLGDNMVLLRAVGAAEFAHSKGKLERFCSENGLRHKAITEIRKLRIQITNEMNTNVRDIDAVVDPELPPPTDFQAKLLRQMLLAGLGDQIAKKISPSELKDGEDRAKFKYAYRANDMEEPVFLHHSSVFKQKLPEFVIYQEIYETNKMYMRGVTAIEPDWLPIYVPNLCNLKEPLTEPSPRYEPENGKVYCTVTGTFGRQAWELPGVEIEYPKLAEAYKWFARFFLEGKVFKKLEKYSKELLCSPSIMVKDWGRLQPRTQVMVKALIARDIRSKEALEEVWEDNPKCKYNYVLVLEGFSSYNGF